MIACKLSLPPLFGFLEDIRVLAGYLDAFSFVFLNRMHNLVAHSIAKMYSSQDVIIWGDPFLDLVLKLAREDVQLDDPRSC